MSLVTLAQFKTYAGITTSDNDAFIQSQLDLVSDTIETYCRRRFGVHNYAQTYFSTDYPFSGKIMTAQWPIISVSGIDLDGTAASVLDFRVHKPSGTIFYSSGFFFGGDETMITYSAGYAVIPTPIVNAVNTLVQERYNKQMSGVNLSFGSDVQRVSIPGAISIDFDYTLNNNDRKNAFGLILGAHLNVLDFYRSDRAILGNGRLIYNEEI